jgi:hypothetical protein
MLVVVAAAVLHRDRVAQVVAVQEQTLERQLLELLTQAAVAVETTLEHLPLVDQVL